MKVVIEGEVDKDFPNLRNKGERFVAEMEKAIRRRLELRDSDVVEIKLRW